MRYRVVPLAILCASLCLIAQDRQPDRTLNFWSSEKETALGAVLAAQVRRQTTPLGLADVDSYVENLGRQLAARMPSASQNWKWSVIKDHQDSSTYEPISLPGGWIFVSVQLFLAANSEGEFAGMLAHAMAHVAERQWIRQTPADGTLLASMPLVFIGGPAALGGDERSLLPVSSLKTQREYELQADRDAVRTIAALGFDPRALLNYIARVQPERTGRSKEFSPLPSLPIRISNLQQAIQNSPALSLRPPDEFFHGMQSEVRQSTSLAMPKKVYRVPSLIHPDMR